MRRPTHVVPSNDREIFIDPPINRIIELIHSNKSKFGTYNFNICGIPFQKFRDSVRNEILQKAVEYTKQITPAGMWNVLNAEFGVRNSESQKKNIFHSAFRTLQSAIIQTGYQPTFYHPGIWIKNHLAYHIAKRVGGVSVNISVDNDTCHENWMCVPMVDKQEITLEKIEFVERSANRAFEELSFSDNNKILCFRDKVLKCLKGFTSGGSQTFEKFANLMLDASSRGDRPVAPTIGEILTIARRKFEDSFGIYNLEVPVSKICECDSFLVFFLTILLDCMRFASIYNYRLECYRKAHKLRSKVQPLPDLKVDGNTIEMPFWAWRQGESRKRLFGQCGVDNEHINLIYENQTVLTFDTGGTVGVEAQLAKLKDLVKSGIKIRPRAITNTMFSRLFFSDLFIHGIGGARYDVITDSLIKDFFGVEPPNFLTASATLYLPYNPPYSPFNKGGKGGFATADPNAHRLLLRDMHYNPDRHLPAHLKTDKKISTLIMEKQKIIETTNIQTCTERSKRNHAERLHKFKRLREINNILEDTLLPYLQQEKTELERMEKIVLQNEIMRNRAYPFCIYPESLLKAFYGQHLLQI